MEPDRAWELLGLDPCDDPEAVRAAYASRLFELHPDHSPRPGANEATAELTAAYRAIRGELARSDAAGSRDTPSTPVVAVAALADDTIGIGAPAPEAFAALVDAGHRLGEPVHVEPASGMIQVVVEFVDGPVCQLLMTLQGRATGVTEAFLTVEPLDERPAPPIEAVTRLLIDTLTA